MTVVITRVNQLGHVKPHGTTASGVHVYVTYKCKLSVTSINFSHCCHIFRGCVSDVAVPPYAANNRLHYGLVVVYGYLHATLPHYYHYAELSEGIELLKYLSDIFCRVCVED